MEITFLPWWAGAIFIIAIVVLCALRFWKKRKNGGQPAESKGTEGNNSWTTVYYVIGVTVMVVTAVIYLLTSGVSVDFLSLDITWMPTWANVLLIVAIILLCVSRKIKVGDLRKWAEELEPEEWLGLLHIGEAVVILAMPIIGYLAIPGTPGFLTEGFLAHLFLGCLACLGLFYLVRLFIEDVEDEPKSVVRMFILAVAAVVLGLLIEHIHVWVYSAVCAIIWSGLLTVMSLVNYIGYKRLDADSEADKCFLLKVGTYLIVVTIVMVVLAVFFFLRAPQPQISGLGIFLGIFWVIGITVVGMIIGASDFSDEGLPVDAVLNAIVITVIILASCGIIYAVVWLVLLVWLLWLFYHFIR